MFMTRSFQTVPVEVGGIFATGIDDIDASVVYADFNLVERIMGDQSYYQIHIALSQLRSEQHVQASIKQALELEVYSWKDLYPALLSALTLEKWAMFFILLLIVCVASMNIVALMSMLVVHKRKDIMILLLQGMSLSEVEWIFILIGLYIACKAIVVGLALALAIGFVLQKYPFIKLPDNLYDTEYLPISIELSNIVIIAFATIVISLLASLYATKSIRSYSMVELLKN
jgi:lipoprotein-releasing system permease protein